MPRSWTCHVKRTVSNGFCAAVVDVLSAMSGTGWVSPSKAATGQPEQPEAGRGEELKSPNIRSNQPQAKDEGPVCFHLPVVPW